MFGASDPGLALEELNLGMDYNQIMEYFDNLKESNAWLARQIALTQQLLPTNIDNNDEEEYPFPLDDGDENEDDNANEEKKNNN